MARKIAIRKNNRYLGPNDKFDIIEIRGVDSKIEGKYSVDAPPAVLFDTKEAAIEKLKQLNITDLNPITFVSVRSDDNNSEQLAARTNTNQNRAAKPVTARAPKKPSLDESQFPRKINTH